jgi:hypothetical protein
MGRPIQMSTLHARGGNFRPSALAMSIRQGGLAFGPWAEARNSRPTSRDHHPALKLEFPMSLSGHEKGPPFHYLENTSKIHPMEDLAGANSRLFRETKSNPTQVATKIKAFFGESAPYFCKVKNSRLLEPEEEQWIKSFNIRDRHNK